MKNRSELFQKFENSVIPIGHIFRESENLQIDSKYVLTAKLDGEKILVFPAATAFILKIDETKTQLVTANHAFPEIEKDIDIALFVISPADNPHDLRSFSFDNLKTYSGVRDYERLPDQDICIFEVDTPDELYKLKPRPVPMGSDFFIGDPVCTMGYPFIGYDGRDQTGICNYRFVNRLTSAHLSSIWVENHQTLIMEFDNYVGPGNSGGPLFNLRTGSAIGIVTATRVEPNPNYPHSPSMTTFSHATYIAEINRARMKFPNLPDFGCSHCYAKK